MTRVKQTPIRNAPQSSCIELPYLVLCRGFPRHLHIVDRRFVADQFVVLRMSASRSFGAKTASLWMENRTDVKSSATNVLKQKKNETNCGRPLVSYRWGFFYVGPILLLSRGKVRWTVRVWCEHLSLSGYRTTVDVKAPATSGLSGEKRAT